jgi:VWFA-related protein
MKLRAGFGWRWLAALTTTAVPLWAQTPPPPTPESTIKVEVRVVLLDVVVANDKGEPVHGLSKDQFEVLEDGARQTVSSFEEHGRTRPTRTAAGLAPQPAQTLGEPLAANVYTNSQIIKASESVNVLLLDWLNTQPADQTYVRNQIIKYLRTVPPGTRLAIFTLGTELRLVQGFTTESSVILAALNRKEGGANPQSVGLLDSKTREASEQEVVEMLIRSDAAPATVSAVQDAMRETAARQTGDRAKLTIQGLLELQRYLAPIPGRKNVFWFSGSFPISNVPVLGVGANYSNEPQSTSQGLGPARIAIYPISAEGVMTAGSVLMDPSQGLTTRARAMDLNSGGNTSDSAKQIAMESIARETGGAAFYNTNGLDREITRAVDEGEHYYTMTYTPTNAARDAKFRNIHVKLAKGSYKLSYRRGYYSEAGSEQAANVAPQNTLLELMRFGMPDFDQIAYNVHVAPADPQPHTGSAQAGVNRDLKGPVTRYRVDFSIPLSELKLTGDTGGTMHGAVQLMLVAYQKNGYPLNLVESKNEFSLKREMYESARNVNIHAQQELDVPTGDVYLRVGLFEQASGHVGTIEVPLLSGAGPPKN